MKNWSRIVIVFLFGAALPWHAFATSSGLNNIPTADTPGDRELVVQTFSNIRLREESNNDYVAGFKMGLRPWGQRFEWGLDGRLGEGDGGVGPAVFQVKYAIQPLENWPTFAIGAANIATTSEDRDKAGDDFKFAIASHDFKWFRLHAGYGFQHDNNTPLLGIDKTFKVFDRDLMLRSDYILINDQDQWMGSLGFIYFLHEHIALEHWVSQPFDNGDPIITIKLNFIWKF